MAQKEQAAATEAPDMAAASTGAVDSQRSGPATEPAGGDGMRRTMRNAIDATADVGTGMASGVSHLAGGMIDVVRDTANTAIDGVGSIGEKAVHTVTGLLVEIVNGVRSVAGAAVTGMRPGHDMALQAEQSEQAQLARQTQQAQPAQSADTAETPSPPTGGRGAAIGHRGEAGAGPIH